MNKLWRMNCSLLGLPRPRNLSQQFNKWPWPLLWKASPHDNFNWLGVCIWHFITIWRKQLYLQYQWPWSSNYSNEKQSHMLLFNKESGYGSRVPFNQGNWYHSTTQRWLRTIILYAPFVRKSVGGISVFCVPPSYRE